MWATKCLAELACMFGLLCGGGCCSRLGLTQVLGEFQVVVLCTRSRWVHVTIFRRWIIAREQLYLEQMVGGVQTELLKAESSECIR